MAGWQAGTLLGGGANYCPLRVHVALCWTGGNRRHQVSPAYTRSSEPNWSSKRGEESCLSPPTSRGRAVIVVGDEVSSWRQQGLLLLSASLFHQTHGHTYTCIGVEVACLFVLKWPPWPAAGLQHSKDRASLAASRQPRGRL